MKILIVGDLHVKRSNLDESVRIFNRILSIMDRPDIGMGIHLGDLYNDHGVITADVQTAVKMFFDKLELNITKSAKSFFNLEGNHDQSGDGIHTSLFIHYEQHSPLRNVFGGPFLFAGVKSSEALYFIPYMRKSEEFENTVKKLNIPKGSLVFCHQDFNGAIYENGMYAPHGANPEVNPEVVFISGHIHKAQKFANVWYPGSPRWFTKSDANQIKGLSILDTDTQEVEFIDSSDICTKYHSFSVKEEEVEDLKKIEIPGNPNTDKYYIEYEGDNPKTIKWLQSKINNLSLKSKKQQVRITHQVSESKGVSESIKSYVETLETSFDKKKLIEVINERMLS